MNESSGSMSLVSGHLVRRARPDDVDALLALRHAAYADDPARPDAMRLPDTRESVAAEVATGHVLVVEGAAGRLLATLHARPVVQMRRLAVAPDAKRAGVGAALLGAALAEATRAGVDAAELEAVEAHPWMRGVYERRGFAPRGLLVRPDGTRWLVMRRALR